MFFDWISPLIGLVGLASGRATDFIVDDSQVGLASNILDANGVRHSTCYVTGQGLWIIQVAKRDGALVERLFEANGI